MAPFAKEKGEENCINQTDDDPREEKIHPTPVEGLKMVNLDEPEKVSIDWSDAPQGSSWGPNVPPYWVQINIWQEVQRYAMYT